MENVFCFPGAWISIFRAKEQTPLLYQAASALSGKCKWLVMETVCTFPLHRENLLHVITSFKLSLFIQAVL